MEARRFDGRSRRESDLRNFSIVMGGLLILLVGAVIFVLFALGSRPMPVGAVSTSSPSAATSASIVPASASAIAMPTGAAPSASFAAQTPILVPSATAIPTPTPTVVAPTLAPTLAPTAPPTAPPTAAPPTAKPAFVGDEPNTAISIASIPFSTSLASKAATAGSADRRCDDERQSTHTVWFKYTATSDADLGALTAGSDYGTVLIVHRLNADGSTSMVGCNTWAPESGSAVRFGAEAGDTYLFMVGSLSRRTGQLHFNLDVAPKRASVEMTLASTGTYDAFGRVKVNLTTKCTGDIRYATLDLELRQVVDRQVHTSYDWWDFSNCRREQVWTLTIASDEYAFGDEPTTAHLRVYYTDSFESHNTSSTSELTLTAEVGPTPSPAWTPSPAP